MTVRAVSAVVLASLALAPVARAAAPGDTLLVSRPAGNAALSPDLFAWNLSGLIEEPDAFGSQNVTSDGRYVVFVSMADGLAPGEDPGFAHVLRKDMQTGAVVAVDGGGNGDSTNPDISDDGRFVAFASRASNLAAADTTHDADVFSKDLQTGTVTLLSPAAATGEELARLRPVISGNGAKVAFSTPTALVAGDTGSRFDVYVLPAGGGTPVLASAKSDGTTASNGDSVGPSITDDATRVAYVSSGNDIDPMNDTTTDADLYVRTLSANASSLASAQNGNDFGTAAGGVDDGQISGDGTKVVFSDDASYLAGDGDTLTDIYRRTLATKVDELMSRSAGGTKSNQDSFSPATDSTGRHAAFLSSATNLGATGSGFHLFVRDAQTPTTSVIVDREASGTLPALAHGGNHMVFQSDAPLADGATPNAVHMSSVTGTGLTLVSRPASGPPLTPGLTATRPPDFSQDDRRVSADGRYVVFVSDAAALGGPVNHPQCWRRDLRTDELLLVSVGAGGPVRSCNDATISGDGGRVAFTTSDPLAAPDSGTDSDAYVHDVAAGTNTLVTRADGPNGDKANGSFPGDVEISADGRHVAFISNATNLGVAAGGFHVYLRDLASGTTQVVDRTTSGALPAGPAQNSSIGVDADGGRVAFATNARLDPAADSDALPDVYVRESAAATTTLASVQSAADGGAKGTSGSLPPAISADGRRVAFLSGAQNLVPALAPWPVSAGSELFVRDLAARTTTMASASASGTAAGDSSIGAFALDATGDTAAFDASGGGSPSNLAPELDGGLPGVLVRRVGTNATVAVVQPGPIGGGSLTNGGATRPALSADGRCLSYYARGRNAFPGVSPDFTQLYLRVLDGDCGTRAPAAGGGVGGPGGAGGPGGSGGPTVLRPGLSGVSMTSRRFRVGRKPTVVVARKAPVGTAFRFTVNQTATVTIRIDRLTKGRRLKKRCVKATRKRRRLRSCTRVTRTGTLTRRGLATGRQRVPFSGRVGKRKLAPGNYRATLTASAAGLRSRAVSLRFTIVR